MMIRSFKAKMAFFSLCTSGLVFVAFAFVLVRVNEQAMDERLDRQMLKCAEGPLRRLMAAQQSFPPAPERRRDLIPPEEWETRNIFPVRLMGREGRVFYCSATWPAWMTPEVLRPLPPTERHEFEPPPPPQDPRHRGEEPVPMMRRMVPPLPEFTYYRKDDKMWRVLQLRFQGVTATMIADLSELQQEAGTFRLKVLLLLLGGLSLLGAGGWLLAGVALRPVREVTRVAKQMTSSALHERIHVQQASDEFMELVRVMNQMLERLEKSFLQAKRFSADAAHELKTPLAILQGQLDHALRHAQPDSAEQHLYVSLLDEVQRLKAIIHKLLLLAQSDSGKLMLTKTKISLPACVKALCEDVPLLAPEVTLDCVCEDDVFIEADAGLFPQVLQNLFSNAIKYNREKGLIRCRVYKEGRQAVLTLLNTLAPGSHIEAEHLFERFYRGDPSHNRQQEGCGLGLSLAREIARAHQGELMVETLTEEAISFRLVLPRVAEPGLDPVQ